MELDRSNASGDLHDALKKVHNEILEGLRHGFFDYTISCEMISGRKRRFIIHAGKSHQYTIPEEALPN